MSAALLAALTGAGLVLPAAQSARAGGNIQVIVLPVDPSGPSAAGLHIAGARTSPDLSLIGGVVANVNAAQLTALQNNPNVLVVPDAPVNVADATSAPGSTSRPPAAVFAQETGANQVVAAGNTGAGATVAVVDTGIDNLPDFAGRLVDGVDLSGENNPFQDSYGHGTFVAGLIAGNGASSGGQYVGEAPGANLVAVKVAGATGVTTMSTVISALNWVVNNAWRDHIGVVNLSLGTVPTTSTVNNPLDRAVESAWHHGVTVVVSAGNAGPFNGTILSPGDDPLAITVGAVDDNGTPSPADDMMTAFSSVGPTSVDGWVKPDVVAPGRSVVSVRAPGSTVDLANPTAEIGNGNFVGSGTSFSAAITSGAAALYLSATPGARPDNVKAALLATAGNNPVGNPFVDGHGIVNAYWATQAGLISLNEQTKWWPTPVGATVSLSNIWSGSSWNGSAWNGSAWNGSAWNGSAWNGSAWNGSAWNGSAWNGSAWNGSAWNGSAWNGSAWNSAFWSGSAWNGSAWNGSAWNGSAWNGSAWNGSAWNGSAWNGSAWNGSAWN